MVIHNCVVLYIVDSLATTTIIATVSASASFYRIKQYIQVASSLLYFFLLLPVMSTMVTRLHTQKHKHRPVRQDKTDDRHKHIPHYHAVFFFLYLFLGETRPTDQLMNWPAMRAFLWLHTLRHTGASLGSHECIRHSSLSSSFIVNGSGISHGRMWVVRPFLFLSFISS